MGYGNKSMEVDVLTRAGALFAVIFIVLLLAATVHYSYSIYDFDKKVVYANNTILLEPTIVPSGITLGQKNTVNYAYSLGKFYGNLTLNVDSITVGDKLYPRTLFPTSVTVFSVDGETFSKQTRVVSKLATFYFTNYTKPVYGDGLFGLFILDLLIGIPIIFASLKVLVNERVSESEYSGYLIALAVFLAINFMFILSYSGAFMAHFTEPHNHTINPYIHSYTNTIISDSGKTVYAYYTVRAPKYAIVTWANNYSLVTSTVQNKVTYYKFLVRG